MASTSETRSSSRVATPWGAASVVEQVVVPQRAGEKRFATVVELLQVSNGEPLVRIAYSTDRTVRRGPVTLRARDLERLWAAVAERPHLAAAFDLNRGAA